MTTQNFDNYGYKFYSGLGSVVKTRKIWYQTYVLKPEHLIIHQNNIAYRASSDVQVPKASSHKPREDGCSVFAVVRA